MEGWRFFPGRWGNSLAEHYMAMPVVKQRIKGLKAVSILGLVTFGLVLLYYINPSSSSFYPPCPFHALTGLHCPGCGSLRAVHQLLHGHLFAAFGLNPLTILSLPFLAYAFLSYLLDGIIGKSLPMPFIPAFCIWSILGVILLFWILRNLPFYPFSLLAP